MSSFSVYALWTGFIAVAGILIICFIREMKAPAQGEEIYEALTRLEEKSKIL